MVPIAMPGTRQTFFGKHQETGPVKAAAQAGELAQSWPGFDASTRLDQKALRTSSEFCASSSCDSDLCDSDFV